MIVLRLVLWASSLGMSWLSAHTACGWGSLPPLSSLHPTSSPPAPPPSCPHVDIGRGNIIRPLKEPTLFLPGLVTGVELPALVGALLLDRASADMRRNKTITSFARRAVLEAGKNSDVENSDVIEKEKD